MSESEIMREEIKKCENVARYLDGERLQLSAEEQALLEEFRLDESAVSNKLPSELPAEMTKIISVKLTAALNARRPQRRTIHLVRWTAAAAAAAIIIITAAVFFQASNSPNSTNLTEKSDTLSQAQFDPALYFQDLFDNTSEFTDPGDDEVTAFIEPLFFDDTAQTVINDEISEIDLIDDYFDEPDNVMLNLSEPARA